MAVNPSFASVRWESISASVRGASHDRSGAPNQDAVRCLSLGDRGLVAVVCDGHGGDRYVRSDVGARIATEVATELGSAVIDHLVADGSGVASGERIEVALLNSVPVLLAYWRDRVVADLRSRPFEKSELDIGDGAGVTLSDEPVVAYGCTLVIGVFGPQWVGLVQIGDGDVTTVTGRSVGSPVPGDERLIGNRTTSLCLPSAVEDARIAVMVDDLPDLVMLSSDGYANSFSSPDWQASVGIDMADQLASVGVAEVERLLPQWLADSAQASGDDVTMALVTASRDVEGIDARNQSSSAKGARKR